MAFTHWVADYTARRSLSSTVVSANAISTDNICLLTGLLKCVKQVFVDSIWWTYNVHLYKICGYCNTYKTLLFHETIADEVFSLTKQTKKQNLTMFWSSCVSIVSQALKSNTWSLFSWWCGCGMYRNRCLTKNKKGVWNDFFQTNYCQAQPQFQL